MNRQPGLTVVIAASLVLTTSSAFAEVTVGGSPNEIVVNGVNEVIVNGTEDIIVNGQPSAFQQFLAWLNGLSHSGK